MEFVVPTILVAFVITGTGDSARIRINFPSLKEEVKRSFIVWGSKSTARKYGVSDPAARSWRYAGKQYIRQDSWQAS